MFQLMKIKKTTTNMKIIIEPDGVALGTANVKIKKEPIEQKEETMWTN